MAEAGALQTLLRTRERGVGLRSQQRDGDEQTPEISASMTGVFDRRHRCFSGNQPHDFSHVRARNDRHRGKIAASTNPANPTSRPAMSSFSVRPPVTVPAANVAGQLGIFGHFGARVPLLACPAVLCLVMVLHCWTSHSHRRRLCLAPHVSFRSRAALPAIGARRCPAGRPIARGLASGWRGLPAGGPVGRAGELHAAPHQAGDGERPVVQHLRPPVALAARRLWAFRRHGEPWPGPFHVAQAVCGAWGPNRTATAARRRPATNTQSAACDRPSLRPGRSGAPATFQQRPALAQRHLPQDQVQRFVGRRRNDPIAPAGRCPGAACSPIANSDARNVAIDPRPPRVQARNRPGADGRRAGARLSRAGDRQGASKGWRPASGPHRGACLTSSRGTPPATRPAAAGPAGPRRPKAARRRPSENRGSRNGDSRHATATICGTTIVARGSRGPRMHCRSAMTDFRNAAGGRRPT